MDATTRLDLALTLSARFRHRELRVALFLLRYADPLGEWQGTFDDVRKVTGDSWRTVARSFAALQAAGVVHKVIDRSHSARWRVICQPCHISDMPTGGMPFPPTPPLLGAPIPARKTPADRPARGMPKLAYQRGGGGEADWGDLTEKPTDAQAEAVRELLAKVRNDETREQIAARCSPELVRFALDAASKAKNALDREGFAVHLLRSGSAAKALQSERERAAKADERKRDRLTIARAAMDQYEERQADEAAELAAIAAAPIADVRAALVASVAEVSGASAFVRVNDATTEQQIRKWARSSAWRQAVAERLSTQQEGN